MKTEDVKISSAARKDQKKASLLTNQRNNSNCRGKEIVGAFQEEANCQQPREEEGNLLLRAAGWTRVGQIKANASSQAHEADDKNNVVHQKIGHIPQKHLVKS